MRPSIVLAVALVATPALAGEKGVAPVGSAAKGPTPKELVEAGRARFHGEIKPVGTKEIQVNWALLQPGHCQDFEVVAGDFHIMNNHRLRNGAPQAMELSADARNEGLLLHKESLKGEYDIEFDFYIRNYSKDASDVTFLCGVDVIDKRQIAVRFGQQVTVTDGKKVNAAKKAIDFAPFDAVRRNVVKISRRNGRMTFSLNGTVQQTLPVTGTLGEGRFGVRVQNAAAGFIRVTYTGSPD